VLTSAPPIKGKHALVWKLIEIPNGSFGVGNIEIDRKQLGREERRLLHFGDEVVKSRAKTLAPVSPGEDAGNRAHTQYRCLLTAELRALAVMRSCCGCVLPEFLEEVAKESD